MAKHNQVRKPSLHVQTAALVLATIGTASCVVPQQAADAIHESLSDPPPTVYPSPTGTVPAPACYADHFQQPAEQVSHSVDILFIADTSGSMAPKRVNVANALDAFVAELPPGTDYRIGVILAHSSKDPNVGLLYTSSPSIPKVLDSSTMSSTVIQNDLKQIMLNAPDVGGEEGEMGSYALLQALQPAKLAQSRALGFFRPDAALAVVTISDENDICAVYPNPLPAAYKLHSSPYPAMPGMTSSEYAIRQRDCAAGNTAQSVITAVKNLQGDRPYVISAVIHTDYNYNAVPNDSYGWGYAETVALANGVTVDIASADYSSGMSQIGALTTVKLTLNTDFTLTHSNVDPTSIDVYVDANQTNFTFDAQDDEVHPANLGHAQSEIDVNYCAKSQVVPLPTPSASPTVSPSPSSSPSVSPTPSPSPTVTPTPSPSPSVSPTPSPSPTCVGPFCTGGGTA